MKYLALVAACLLTVTLAAPANATATAPVEGTLQIEMESSGLFGTLARVPIAALHPELDPGEVVDLTWSVTSRTDGETVVTGSDSWTVGEPMPRLGVPEGTKVRWTHLAVHAAVDSPRLGHLEGSAESDGFSVDAVGPELVTKVSGSELFPAHDRYLDEIEIKVKDNERIQQLVIDLVRRGVVTELYNERETGVPQGERTTFDGTVDGRTMPAGRYTLRVLAYDGRNEPTVDTYPLRIDDRRRVKKTYQRTIPAARTLADQYVGACSHLGTADGRGWKGSLGLYSTVPCGKDNGSVVATLHGARVPTSVGGFLQGPQLSLYGGAARGESSAYLVHGWLKKRNDKFVNRRQIGGSLGDHKVSGVDPREVVRQIDGKSWIYWQLGLTDGSRYDVKSFTITMDYYALVAPMARTASDAKTIAEPSGAPGPGYTAPKTEAALLLAAYKPGI